MIASIEGTLREKQFDHVVVDVAGVGYQVFVPAISLNKLPANGSHVSLQTYLHVREGVMQLYGFTSAEEKDLFEKFISIPGIGPKLALSILSVFSVPSFKKAVLASDVDAITAIPGIGKKGAQRVILELREKLAVPEFEGAVPTGSGDEVRMVYSEAKHALIGLGYTSAEATKALDGFPATDDETPKVEDLLKYALKNLAQI
jgi:Holliday junction DNA helicase RuvA